MLYVLHGRDTQRGREKLGSLLESLYKKKPDASVIRVDDEQFDALALDELISGQGLFERKQIIVFDNVFRNTVAMEVVSQSLKDIASSQNIFILFEEMLDKKILSKFQKHAEKIQEFDKKDSEVAKKSFDIFSLTDAFGKRDKKKLWVLYQKARIHNVSNEEVHGILFWQIKSMLLARSAPNAKEAGLNPFVYKKAIAFQSNYSDAELKALSAALISIYHDARRGIHDLGISLERFVLDM